jgi:hypothetical protein
MVIRTQPLPLKYPMGSSDPLPAGFQIRFGGLEFQAMATTCVSSRGMQTLRLRYQLHQRPDTACVRANAQGPIAATQGAALAEGSKTKDSAKKQKRGKRGKKAQRAPRTQEPDEDSDEVHAVDPTRNACWLMRLLWA